MNHRALKDFAAAAMVGFLASIGLVAVLAFLLRAA